MQPRPLKWTKKEIGAFHEMGASAVNQASRRLEQAIREEPALKKLKGQIAQRLNMCNVETPNLILTYASFHKPTLTQPFTLREPQGER
ncbi:MAG: hypothetical protein FJ115_17945 [Deltaproteobacteria bacterium]|nr:hypothetical protein [Deltaproteobacteria bacterium]